MTMLSERGESNKTNANKVSYKALYESPLNSDLFFENGAKLKIPNEIFPPLHTMLKNYHFVSNVISSWWEGGHFAQSFPMSEIELKNVLSIMAMQFTSTHCITTQCKKSWTSYCKQNYPFTYHGHFYD